MNLRQPNAPLSRSESLRKQKRSGSTATMNASGAFKVDRQTGIITCLTNCELFTLSRHAHMLSLALPSRTLLSRQCHCILPVLMYATLCSVIWYCRGQNAYSHNPIGQLRTWFLAEWLFLLVVPILPLNQRLNPALQVFQCLEPRERVVHPRFHHQRR